MTFHLLHEIGEGVAIDEAPLLGVVGMQVEVEGQPVISDQMFGECLDAEDSGLQMPIRRNVESIEISTICIHTEMSVKHAIHVDHGHHHKYEHLP